MGEQRFSKRLKRHLRDTRDAVLAISGLAFERGYGLLARAPATVSRRPIQRGLVVSLTTIPDRLHTVHLAIESMLRQSCRPENVILWLDENADLSSLPRALFRQQRRGLIIRQRPDIGPYTKLIHCLREYPEHVIVTVDDDFVYRRHLVRDLLNMHRVHPDCIVCDRAHFMLTDEQGELLPYNSWNMFSPGVLGPSHCLFPTGVGGVLYAPDHLHRDVTRDDLFLRLSPKADDIWFKNMALLRGTKAVKTREAYRFPHNIEATRESGLFADNLHHNRNDRQMSAVLTHYGRDRLLDPIRQCQKDLPRAT